MHKHLTFLFGIQILRHREEAPSLAAFTGHPPPRPRGHPPFLRPLDGLPGGLQGHVREARDFRRAFPRAVRARRRRHRTGLPLGPPLGQIHRVGADEKGNCTIFLHYNMIYKKLSLCSEMAQKF